MAKTTIVFGIGIIILGLVAYFGTGRESVTALIPAFLGLPLALVGVLAAKDIKRVLMMHIAVVIGVVGILGTAGGLIKLAKMLAGQEITRPSAVIVQSIMAVMMIAFVSICVQSFIKARKVRNASK